MLKKDLFVVHTKSNRAHIQTYDALLDRLRKVGVSVYEYADWRWNEPDRVEKDWRLDEDAGAIMSEVERDMFGVEPPRRVNGDVDRTTLDRLISGARVVLILDVQEDDVTQGLREESKIVDSILRRLSPYGHFAVVRYGDHEYFGSRHPLYCGETLDLRLADSLDAAAIDQVVLFAVRVLIHKEMSSHSWSLPLETNPITAISALDEWAEKLRPIVQSCDPLTLLDPDVQIIELIEEILAWIVCFQKRLGAEEMWGRIPGTGDRVMSFFDQVCRYTDLSEQGLGHLISVLEGLGPRGRNMLAEINKNPICRESKNVQAVSWSAGMESTRALARVQGRNAVGVLSDAIISLRSSEEMFGVLVEVMGRLGETESLHDRERVAQFLMNLMTDAELNERATVSCISALGKVGNDTYGCLAARARRLESIRVSKANVIAGTDASQWRCDRAHCAGLHPGC